MSLDKRIETKTQPMLGCHTELNKYKERPAEKCDYDHRTEERGCEGCRHRNETEK